MKPMAIIQMKASWLAADVLLHPWRSLKVNTHTHTHVILHETLRNTDVWRDNKPTHSSWSTAPQAWQLDGQVLLSSGFSPTLLLNSSAGRSTCWTEKMNEIPAGNHAASSGTLTVRSSNSMLFFFQKKQKNRNPKCSTSLSLADAQINIREPKSQTWNHRIIWKMFVYSTFLKKNKLILWVRPWRSPQKTWQETRHGK